MSESKTILINRTDSIGDVVLTLPMAGVIKDTFPNYNIIFLGRNYTKDIISLSKHVDQFISYDELLKLTQQQRIQAIKSLNIDIAIHVFPVKEIAGLIKQSGVKTRIGTTNRIYHWLTCNRLVKLSRKNSPLHESQLNLKLLAPIGINKEFALDSISSYYGFEKIPTLHEEFLPLLQTNKKKIILHPKSKGSAKEWGLENFSQLIQILHQHHYQVYISGTKEEGDLIKPLIINHPEVIDLTGRMSLQQFISFIHHCDGLVAASTGPLHIAAALGKIAIGLFSPKKPIHPGRWKPIGPKAYSLVKDENCSLCFQQKECDCIKDISAETVLNTIERETT